MLNPTLYKSLALLDGERHKSFKLRQDIKSIRGAETVNLVFITAAEFESVCRDYPILFVKAGEDSLGRKLVAPYAIMGLQEGENLYLKRAKSGAARWLARYVPVFVRIYPFTLAQIDASSWGVCIDEAWRGWSQTSGIPLFDAAGKPTELVSQMHGLLKGLEWEIEQTRLLGERLMHLGLLEERRFTAAPPEGGTFAVEGFLCLDEKRLEALSKMQIAELHRGGALHALSLHKASLGNFAELAERRWKLPRA